MSEPQVHIKKNLDSLVLENFEQVGSANSRQKLKLPASQWEMYKETRDEFMKLHEEVRKEVLNNSCPESLWVQYKDIRAKLFVQHGVLNEAFSKYAI